MRFSRGAAPLLAPGLFDEVPPAKPTVTRCCLPALGLGPESIFRVVLLRLSCTDWLRWCAPDPEGALRELLLPYEVVGQSRGAEAPLLTFLKSTYRIAIDLGSSDRKRPKCTLGYL